MSAPVETIDRQSQPGDLKLVAKPGNAFIYENAATLPRVLFPVRARAAVFEDILETGRWPEFDPATTVLLASPTASGDSRRPGEVHILRYGQTRIELEAVSPDGGWVVVHDVWHPWWQATVDGRPTRIERANVLFRAVPVPPGRHTVVMEFRPFAGIWRALADRFWPTAQSS